MNLNFNRSSFVVYFVFALLIVSTFVVGSFHPQRYRNFILQVPDTDAYPGETITIVGNITNMGIWSTRALNLTVENAPFDYALSPDHFDLLTSIRDWNPQQGVFRLPHHFNITITVPENATGAYLVKVVGQEFGSPRQVSNSTEFILRVLSVPKISTSDISVPAVVTRFESFTVSFGVKNEGLAPTLVNASIEVPGNWQVTELEKQVSLGGDSTQTVEFNVTPSESPGTVAVKTAYEFRGNVTTVTKSSSLITPIAQIIPEEPEEPEAPTGFAGAIEFVKGLSPIVIGILILIFIIIMWNLYKILRVLTRKKKKAEEMK